MGDTDQLRSLVEQTVAWGGGLDIVVNNAGVSLANDVSTQSEEEFEVAWARSLDVNVTAQARLVRHALPHLFESDAARVVNMASTEAVVATAGLVGYAASKAAVTGITRSLAVELGRHGVTVNCICPGPIETAMTQGFEQSAKDVYARRRVPLRRYGTPEEVAQLTLSLCLPAASYVNGAVLPVHGGMSVRHS